MSLLIACPEMTTSDISVRQMMARLVRKSECQAPVRMASKSPVTTPECQKQGRILRKPQPVTITPMTER